MSEAERQTEREERVLACVESLKISDLNYHGNTNETERRVKAQAWALTLEDVPPDCIRDLMQVELRNRTNEFPPSAPDLLRLWKWQKKNVEREPVIGSDGFEIEIDAFDEIAWMRQLMVEGKTADEAVAMAESLKNEKKAAKNGN